MNGWGAATEHETVMGDRTDTPARARWFETSRAQLLRKLAYLHMPAETQVVHAWGADETEILDPQWRCAPGTAAQADALFFVETDPATVRLAIARPDVRFVLIDQGDCSRKSTSEFLGLLEENGFELRSAFAYGFVVAGLALLLPSLRAPASRLSEPVERFLAWLLRVERFFLPYVRFVTGISTAIAAERQPPRAAPGLDLSVVIPAFNEAARIGSYLTAIETYFESATGTEVLVVDDGSTDTTAAFVRGKFPNVRVLSLYRNFGKGGAVQAGVLNARGRRILIADADGATPIQELEALSRELERGRDLAIGSRYLNRSRITIKQGAARRAVSRLGNLVIRALTGLSYFDTQCGFKLLRAEVAHVLLRNVRTRGFGFDFDLLTLAKRLQLQVVEVPVEWHDVAGSKVGDFELLRVFWQLIRLRFETFFRFSLVGVANTGVDFIVHNGLAFAFGGRQPLDHTLYQAGGFLAANTFSYFMNSGFTFRVSASYLRFLTVSVITVNLVLGTYYGLSLLLNTNGNLLVANLLKANTVAISVVVNYLGYRVLVFRER